MNLERRVRNNETEFKRKEVVTQFAKNFFGPLYTAGKNTGLSIFGFTQGYIQGNLSVQYAIKQSNDVGFFDGKGVYKSARVFGDIVGVIGLACTSLVLGIDYLVETPHDMDKFGQYYLGIIGATNLISWGYSAWKKAREEVYGDR